MKTNGSSTVILSTEPMSTIARNVAEFLIPRGPYSHMVVETKRFHNGEVGVHIPETIRGKHVYFLHSAFHPDVNAGIVEMLLVNDAVRLASAQSIDLVIPFLPYARQDRKDRPRVPISARAIARLIQTCPAVKRIITMDMHAEQEEGFFDIPVDNLRGRTLFAEYYQTFVEGYLDGDLSNVMVVAPDFGGAVRAKRFAKSLGNDVKVGILEKERRANSTVAHHKFIGEEPKSKFVILFDDMIDTANTTIAGVQALRDMGAREVHVCATHAVFSESNGSSAEKKLADAKVKVVVTDSIPRGEAYKSVNGSWLTVLPIDDLLAKVIRESDTPGGSVSSLSERGMR